MVAVVDYKLGFYETVVDLRKMCLRVLGRNLRMLRWERHAGLDLSAERIRSHND